MILAEKRIYEVVFIVDPDTPEEESKRLTDNLQTIVTDQGGTVVKSEVMGRRQLAYQIGRKNEGTYVLFEVEGTGREIAEQQMAGERGFARNGAHARWKLCAGIRGQPG